MTPRRRSTRPAGLHWPALAGAVLQLLPVGAASQGLSAPGSVATVQVAPQPALPEPQLLALLLVNLARFSERSDGSARKPEMLVCTVGVGVGGLAIDTLTSRKAGGRPVRHRAVGGMADDMDCQLLFIAAGERRRLGMLLRESSSAGVLTVSDAPGFVDAGGMVQLEAVGDRFVFDINLAALRAAGLRLPPGVLSLARRVIGAE